MDAEKVELSCCLWESAKTFHRALETLANDSGDGQALEAAARSLQPLRPYLSSELSERILYLFSGAEIEPEDLRNAGLRLLLESSEAICKALTNDGKAEQIRALFALPETAAVLARTGCDPQFRNLANRGAFLERMRTIVPDLGRVSENASDAHRGV